MELKIITKDPLNILLSTRQVIEKARSVFINKDKISEVIKKIKEELKKDANTPERSFGTVGNLEDDIQIIFLEDVVNFCFWPDKDKQRWSIEWPKEKITNGGWYTLKACFERSLVEQIPVLDSAYLASISITDVGKIFNGSNNIQIPLLEKRHQFLREAGELLLKKYDGKFANIVKDLDFDAIKIVRFLYENLPAFKDIFKFEGLPVYFLKKAQICANDLSCLSQNYSDFKIKNVEHLTAFADYKLPQMLEDFGAIEYTPELQKKINNYELISSGSREELEIRAVTIWAIEFVRQKIPQYTATQIDNVLWDLSQIVKKERRPYHRTRSAFY